MTWCFASAAVRGLSHLRAGTRLQDAQQCKVFKFGNARPYLIALVADGAGSAKFGGQGASIICRTMMSHARDELGKLAELPENEAIWSWLDVGRDRIQMAAHRRELLSRDFAATLVMAIASDSEVVTAHVGDGAIVARHRETRVWSLLSAPQHGEYASTTYFVTDDPCPAMRIERFPNVFDAFALFSDGIENLVLDSVTGEPSSAFFNPMAKPLEQSDIVGKDRALCLALGRFLNGESLNERTDDDKTLIIAVQK